jgi:transposase
MRQTHGHNAPEIRALHGLIRRYQSLVQMRTEEQNRLQAPMIDSVVKASIEATLAHLDHEVDRVEREIDQLFNRYPPLRRQRELLTSIPGIGETTAARILGEMSNIAEFRDLEAVAAYAGLSPRHYESGLIHRPSHIAKTGNASLRTALYFPAISAMRYNPLFRCFADRLRVSRI